MAAVTICSDSGAPKEMKSVIVSPSICHEVMGDWMPWSSFFECWVLRQLFHSPLSPSSRGSLVLCFLPQGWCHLHIWGCCIYICIYISPNNLDSSLCFWHYSIPIIAHLPNWYFKQECTISNCIACVLHSPVQNSDSKILWKTDR